MNITANSESKAQTIAEFTSYLGSYWSSIRLVGWIGQDKVNNKTTLYTKWQRNQWNYWIYNNDSHSYTAKLDGKTSTDNFAFTFSQNNGISDLTTAKKITVSHNSSGEFTGNLVVNAYFETNSSTHAWGTVSSTVSVTFPTITVKPAPSPSDHDEPLPDPPADLGSEDSQYFYVYCDNKLLYAAGLQEYPLIDPKLTLEVNRAGSFEFTLPKSSVMYDEVHLLKSTIDVRMGNYVIWRGRPLKPQRDMLNNKKWICEGFLAWLSDRQLLPYKYTNIEIADLCKEFLTRYNSRATDDRKIIYKYTDFSGKVTIEQENNSDAWTEFNNVLLNGLGAFAVPYLTKSETGVQLLSSYARTSSQVIQFGTNLVDYEDYIDGSQIFTAVRPFGKEVDGERIGLTNPSFVINQSAIDRYGRIEKTVFFDEITDVAKLRTEATKYLNEGIQEAMTITLKAVDLHLLNVNIARIRLGDMVRVVSVPHGIDAYFLCTKIVYDLAHPKNNIYTFGATQLTISSLTETNRNKYVITEGA